jgi:hypothetical protein
MSQRYLSGSNGFVPSATGQAIAFTRDPSRFKVNSYTQNLRTPKVIGLYAVLDRDQPARVKTDQEFAWEDGDPRPSGNNNMGTFQWREFKVERRDYPYTVGEQAIEQAEGWNPKAFFNASVLQQAMTNRTNRIVTLLQTAANWPTASTATAKVLNGSSGTGAWALGSNDPTNSGFLNIKKSILEVCRRINLATNAVVEPKDLVLVISPGMAIAISETSEYHTYLEKSRFALGQLHGDVPNQNEQWGIGTRLYGVECVVEDCVSVSTRPSTLNSGDVTGGGGTRAYVMADASPVIISRKGGIDGNYGSPSYSTLQCYFYKYELAIEAFDDVRNKRVEGHVVEQYKEILAAPAAGFLITSA